MESEKTCFCLRATKCTVEISLRQLFRQSLEEVFSETELLASGILGNWVSGSKIFSENRLPTPGAFFSFAYISIRPFYLPRAYRSPG